METNTDVKMIARLMHSINEKSRVAHKCGDSSNIDEIIADFWDRFDILVLTAGFYRKMTM